MSDPTRVGVFVCDCGSNIAGVVDVPAVVRYAAGLEHVVFVDEGRWSCSVDALARMQRIIREQALNRVVVAACTPRTHEPLFKATVKEAGLNPYLLEFVSIREQVSWVHMHERDAATWKAQELVRMGVAKAVLLEEGAEIRLPVGTTCLVIGGGMAGMTAALHVADQGFGAVLVEKAPALGGLLSRISTVIHGRREVPATELVRAAAARIEAHPGIRVFTGAEIESLGGYVGNYQLAVRAGGVSERIDAATVIVATGMREIDAAGHFRHGEDPRVVTQLELEERLRRGDRLDGVEDVVIVQCVGSRNETRGCCAIGCAVAVKNALRLAADGAGRRVHLLYRDLSLVKDEHLHLEDARQAGVRFLRFPDDRYPELLETEGKLAVRVHDLLLDRDLELAADLLVLTTAYRGDDSVDRLKGLLKVSANADGFFQEAHVKLGPLDFPAEGIALGGCAKSPKFLRDSLEEGMGAAMRVSIPMKRGYVEAAGIVAELDLEDCENCGLCAKQCPYGAIQLSDQREPSLLQALCKGCGLCAADCPMECISIVHYSDAQLAAQVDAALAERPAEKIVGFVCHWCALGGVDMAGVSRLQYPPHARLIRVMCSARVPIRLVERAFERGAAGVLVAGCEFPTCHYITGNYACDKRMERARKKLAKKGYDPARLWTLWCSAADGPKFAGAMREMVRALGLPAHNGSAASSTAGRAS
ncbi:MAG: hydrogenase iron-sulfur subunit [Planctomycetes bacterium]|nr:hydrogenase iron-sulfur subunit [Planctomycetota bacterium]